MSVNLIHLQKFDYERNDELCPICQDNLEGTVLFHPTSDKVRHAFHSSCLHNWIVQKNYNATCPLCPGTPISLRHLPLGDPTQLTQLFLLAVKQHLNFAKALLRDFPEEIHGGAKNLALIMAIHPGNEEFIKFLIETGFEFSPQALGAGMLGAEQFGSDQILEAVFPKDRQIPSEVFNHLISVAKNKNATRALRYFVRSGQIGLKERCAHFCTSLASLNLSQAVEFAGGPRTLVIVGSATMACAAYLFASMRQNI